MRFLCDFKLHRIELAVRRAVSVCIRGGGVSAGGVGGGVVFAVVVGVCEVNAAADFDFLGVGEGIGVGIGIIDSHPPEGGCGIIAV